MLIAWQLKMSAFDSGSVFENSANSGVGPKLILPFIRGWVGPSFPIWRPGKRSLASAPRRSSLLLLTCRWRSSCVVFNVYRAASCDLREITRISGSLHHLRAFLREYLVRDSQQVPNQRAADVPAVGESNVEHRQPRKGAKNDSLRFKASRARSHDAYPFTVGHEIERLG